MLTLQITSPQNESIDLSRYIFFSCFFLVLLEHRPCISCGISISLLRHHCLRRSQSGVGYMSYLFLRHVNPNNRLQDDLKLDGNPILV